MTGVTVQEISSAAPIKANSGSMSSSKWWATLREYLNRLTYISSGWLDLQAGQQYLILDGVYLHVLPFPGLYSFRIRVINYSQITEVHRTGSIA